jgi:hypothetical protein
MWERVLELTDRLFGDGTPPASFERRALARYLGLVAVLALVVVARRPDAISRPQFWGVDGSVFFHDQVTRGLHALCSLFGGFPFVVQRLVASLAGIVPTVAAPLAYNAAAILITALTMATFSLPAFRHLVGRDGVRAVACVATVCIPADQGMLASPSALGYFLAVWLVYLAVMRTPRTRVGTGAWCLGGALAVLSAPLAALAMPLCLLRAVRGAGRRRGADVAFGVAQVGTQLAVLAVSGVLGGRADLPEAITRFSRYPLDPWSLCTMLGWVVASYLDAAVFTTAGFARLEALGTLAVVVPAVLVGAAIALACRGLSAGGRITVGLATYVLVASFALVLAGRPLIVLILQTVTTGTLGVFGPLGLRHRMVPSIALVLLAAGLFDGARRSPTRIAALAAAGLLAASWAPGFRLPPVPDLNWPLWAARLDRKLASGSREPLVIPSYPPRFFDIRFDAPASGSGPDSPSRAPD